MKYGMTFILDVYDFEEETEHHILTTPGDYIRTQQWASANLAEDAVQETVRDLYVNYANLYSALKRRGQLEDFGLPGELTIAVVEQMADRMSIYVNAVGDDKLPLKGQRKK